MFAVVETGGKQYHVKTGDVIKVETLDAKAGDIYKFETVLMANGLTGDKAAKATVSGEVLEHRKTDKIIVFKKKRRHNYRRKRGHRQQITVLRIKEIKA